MILGRVALAVDGRLAAEPTIMISSVRAPRACAWRMMRVPASRSAPSCPRAHRAVAAAEDQRSMDEIVGLAKLRDGTERVAGSMAGAQSKLPLPVIAPNHSGRRASRPIADVMDIRDHGRDGEPLQRVAPVRWSCDAREQAGALAFPQIHDLPRHRIGQSRQGGPIGDADMFAGGGASPGMSALRARDDATAPDTATAPSAVPRKIARRGKSVIQGLQGVAGQGHGVTIHYRGSRQQPVGW